MVDEDNKSFGVSKPVGHVVVSFPDAGHAGRARQALADGGFAPDALHAYTDHEMLERMDSDIANAGFLASIGQELNLVRAQRELALQGYHWLIVRVDGDDQAEQVAEAGRQHHAARAQRYGAFIIEELIERPGDLGQVGESPERGLDPQTPSGEEADIAEPAAADAGRLSGLPAAGSGKR